MTASTAFRQRYVLLIEVGLLLALACLVAAFAVPIAFEDDVTVIRTPDEVIQAVEIPVTTQPLDRPPPPPPAPVEVPDSEVGDIDIDLPTLAIDLARSAPLPALTPPEDDAVEEEPEGHIFVVVEEPPVLIGGLAGLQRRVAYPELARRAGIWGTVVVQFVVDEKGRVVDAAVLSEPGGGLGDAALDAVRDVRFEPGKQRGKPVKVRFSLPVTFSLR